MIVIVLLCFDLADLTYQLFEKKIDEGLKKIKDVRMATMISDCGSLLLAVIGVLGGGYHLLHAESVKCGGGVGADLTPVQ